MSMSGARLRHARHAAILAAVISAAGISEAGAGAVSMLIFDASNSMNSPFDGGSRIEATKATLAEAVAGFTDKLDLGLAVFGHREKQSCHDVEIKLNSSPDSTQKVAPAVQNVTAQGVSSLAQSLTQAAGSLRYRERSATIIALADSAGVENCRVDTCATIEKLRRDSKDLVVHLIAVGAKDAELPHLRCIAATTGGMFTRVESRGELTSALISAFARASEQNQVAEEFVVPPPRPKPIPRTALADLPPREKPGDDEADTAIDAAQAPANGDPRAEESPAETDNAVAPENRVSVFAPTRPGEETAEEVAAPDASEATSDIAASNEAPSGPAPSPAAASAPGDNVTALAPSRAGNASDIAPRPLAASDALADEEAEPPAPSEEMRAPEETSPATSAARVLDIADGDEKFSISLAPPAPHGSTILVKRRGDLAPPPSATASAEPDSTDSAGDAEAPTMGRIRLSALIVENTKPLASGVEWEILAPGDTGKATRPVARSSEAEPEFEIPAGEYLVKSRFGSATRSQRMSVAANKTETLAMVLGAGGLQIDPVNAGAEDPDAVILNTINAAGTTSSPIVEDLPSGTIVYLNAGIYRVESRYGMANAIARADIEVQPGKLVRAKINHRAGPARFQLLASEGREPLDGVSWRIQAEDGSIVAQSDDTAPRIVFAEGRYEVIAERGEEIHRTSFEIRPGEETVVDITQR